MTEQSGRYTRDDGTLFSEQKSPTEAITQSFIDGVQDFHWKADYIKFCEVLGLEANDYADQKYRTFQELMERLNEFEPDTLAKMIDFGNSQK